MTSNQLLETEKILEPINIIIPDEEKSISDNSSSYHPPTELSTSSKSSIALTTNNMNTYNEIDNCVQNNALCLLRNLYSNQTSSESDQSSQLKSDNNNSKKIKKRKNNVDHSKWKRSVQKKCRMSGIQYVNRSNKVVFKKSPKPVNCSNCRFKCNLHFSEDMRNEICRNYWNLADYTRQRCFIASNVEETSVKRFRPRAHSDQISKPKSKSRVYYLPQLINDNDKTRQRVCVKFFCLTLSISYPVVDLAMKNRNDEGMYTGIDGRTGRTPPNKTSIEDITEIKKHINSFPKMQSHYCRRDSKKLYLSSELNL